MFTIPKHQFASFEKKPVEKPNLRVVPDDNAFDTAQQALTFATEILRIKQFPKITQSYQNGCPPPVVAAGGEPTGDTAYALALSVYQCLHRLEEEFREILQLHAWGDYVTPARFKGAEAIQEKARQEGKRVRLSHRYSHRQLATILDVSKSTAARRLDKAYMALSGELERCGLVWGR